MYIKKITRAYAKVVLKLPVGGRKPGSSPRILESRITKNEVANSGKYVLAAFFEPNIPASRFNKKSIERITTGEPCRDSGNRFGFTYQETWQRDYRKLCRKVRWCHAEQRSN